MELKHYLDTVWRRKWIIAVTLVLAMAVVVTGTLLMTPIYSASAVLRVGTIAAGSVDYVNFDTQYGDRLMNTYVQIATTRPVLAELQARLGSGPVPAVKAEVIANTELIRLTATDPNPARASLAAQSLAEILIARMTAPGGAAGQSEADTIGGQLIQLQAELAVVQAQHDQLATQKPPNPSLLATLQDTIDLKQSIYATLLRQQAQSRLRDALQAASLSVIEPAVTPLTPLQPNLLLNLSMGFLVALAGGLGLAFLVENLAPPPAIGAAREPLPSAPALTTASAAMKSEASARRS